jgi:hypothetical protein
MAYKDKVKQPKEIHAYVCTPAYDGRVECNYSQSLAESSFCAPLYSIRMTAGVMGNGAFIDLARNLYVKKFLEEFTDCTHLFFIDADLGFEARGFIGLLQSGLPICAGVYRRRQEPEDYPCRFMENPEGGGFWVENDWVICDRVPTGFLCIRRDVLEEMAKDAPKIYVHGQNGLVPWVFHTSFDGEWVPKDGAKFIGEDFGFCADYVKKYGEYIPVWPNLNFRHGGYEGNLSKFLDRQKDAQLAQLSPQSSAA